MAKYLIVPGWVTSKNDGDKHFISAERLIDLYGINPQDCRIFNDDGKSHRGFIRKADEIILEPDFTGEYKLPKELWEEKR